MTSKITPSLLASWVALASAPGCGISLEGYDTLPCAADGSSPALLQGFNLEAPVDFIAVLEVGTGTTVESTGTACANAVDTAACEAAMDEALGYVPDENGFRYGECVSFCPNVVVLLTQGDEVTLLTETADLAALLGTVDTPEEAVAHVMLNGYDIDCGNVGEGGVRAADDGFEVIATHYVSTCSPIVRDRVQLGVSTDGEVVELDSQELSRNMISCVGRRPAGLADDAVQPAEPRAAAPDLGAWLADIARLEAASVYAFTSLGQALAAHGAPPALLERVARARRDEVRHAREMAGQAERFGGEVRAPVVRQVDAPSLEALAVDNAVEGCVRETFGALIGLWQAGHAADPALRSALARIGAEEAEHATLSWDIAAWAEPQLDPAARARVRAARDRALADLCADVCPPPPFAALAGLPDAPAQRRLITLLQAHAAA